MGSVAWGGRASICSGFFAGWELDPYVLTSSPVFRLKHTASQKKRPQPNPHDPRVKPAAVRVPQEPGDGCTFCVLEETGSGGVGWSWRQSERRQHLPSTACAPPSQAVVLPAPSPLQVVTGGEFGGRLSTRAANTHCLGYLLVR